MALSSYIKNLHEALSRKRPHYWLSLLIALVAVLAISSLAAVVTLRGDTSVSLIVRVQMDKDDALRLYYLSDTSSSYNDNASIEQKFKGSEKTQTIVFSLPDNLRIKKLRLDISSIAHQKTALLHSIYLEYNNAQLSLFSKTDEFSEFELNEYVHSPSLGILEFSANNNYDPYLSSNDISKQYSKLLRAQRKIPYLFVAFCILALAFWLYYFLYASSKKSIAVFYSIASCLFVLVLLLPALNSVFNFHRSENQEKRKLSLAPSISETGLLAYPQAFEKYYNDNFGFRDLLVKWGGQFKYAFFSTSSVPDKVAVGKEDWLFLNGNFYCITQELMSSNLYTKEQLISTVSSWQQRQQQLAKDSIAYLHAFFPDKHNIYPEFMPYSMRVINKDTLHHYDQVINYLASHNSTVKLIDVRDLLLSEKKRTKIYQKYDSHWNAHGAFIAYTELMKELAKQIPNFSYYKINDYQIRTEKFSNGDLAQILGVAVQEENPVYTLKTDVVQTVENKAKGYPAKTKLFVNSNARTSLCLLMYRDSFTEAMIPFLNNQFAKVVLIWGEPYSAELVKRVKPDVVIEGYASRYFK